MSLTLSHPSARFYKFTNQVPRIGKSLYSSLSGRRSTNAAFASSRIPLHSYRIHTEGYSHERNL